MASKTITASPLVSSNQNGQQPYRHSFSVPTTGIFDVCATTSSNFELRPPMPSASQPSSQQSFTMSQQSQGPLAMASSYRSFGETAPHMGQAQIHAPQIHAPPQIYSAVYSNIDVYEMEVNSIAVMRRQADGWLNATQILKVAGVEKAKRTKILEKEIQTGEHEKVQGGYGKYQGTWIKFDRGVEVCRQYGVEDILRPLLTYNTGQDGAAADRSDINTPTKEQAMAAQRKKMYAESNNARTNSMGGTFFKNISTTASHAVAAISKARFDSPGPRNRAPSVRPASFSRQNSSMQNGDDFPGNSQQSFVSDYGQGPIDSAYSTQDGQAMYVNGASEPPRKRQRVITPADSFVYPGGSQGNGQSFVAEPFPGSPTEPNDSFVFSQQSMHNGNGEAAHDGVSPLPPLPYEASPDADRKRQFLMNLFMEVEVIEQAMQETRRIMSPRDLDMPIDSQSHTALHWAATLSRMPLLRGLVSAGASPFRVNMAGETPLMRACIVTNSMDLGTFPDLLDVLGCTIDVRDDKGRTVLHHIALTSAVKGRNQASRYYLNSLLEWIVRQGQQSAPSSQNTGVNGNGVMSSTPPNAPKMGLGRFMSEIVNAQDRNGDTALNIAARIGNRSIVQQLLEVNADPKLANRAGLRPLDFGIGSESVDNGVAGDVGSDKNGASSQRSKESSDEIQSSISNLLHEASTTFQSELQEKQASIDQLHLQLRSTSAQLGDARRALEAAVAGSKNQHLARQKAANLSRAVEEQKTHMMRMNQARASRAGNHLADEAAAVTWETELATSLEAGQQAAAAATGAQDQAAAEAVAGAVQQLPTTAILRARITAMRSSIETTRKATSGLKARGKDVELKYRRVVSLCTGVPEKEVDTVVDSLVRAVDSEKGELELGRVRRFLGGVEGMVH